MYEEPNQMWAGLLACTSQEANTIEYVLCRPSWPVKCSVILQSHHCLCQASSSVIIAIYAGLEYTAKAGCHDKLGISWVKLGFGWLYLEFQSFVHWGKVFQNSFKYILRKQNWRFLFFRALTKLFSKDFITVDIIALKSKSVCLNQAWKDKYRFQFLCRTSENHFENQQPSEGRYWKTWWMETMCML